MIVKGLGVDSKRLPVLRWIVQYRYWYGNDKYSKFVNNVLGHDAFCPVRTCEMHIKSVIT